MLAAHYAHSTTFFILGFSQFALLLQRTSKNVSFEAIATASFRSRPSSEFTFHISNGVVFENGFVSNPEPWLSIRRRENCIITLETCLIICFAKLWLISYPSLAHCCRMVFIHCHFQWLSCPPSLFCSPFFWLLQQLKVNCVFHLCTVFLICGSKLHNKSIKNHIQQQAKSNVVIFLFPSLYLFDFYLD